MSNRSIKFSSDGIRALADEYPLTIEGLKLLSQGIAFHLNSLKKHTPIIVIGRDTRYSGQRILQDFAKQLSKQSITVYDLGVLTTPAIAYMTKHLNADLGISVTASHNPVIYNGLKFLDSNGWRISNNVEVTIAQQGVMPLRDYETSKGAIIKKTDLASNYIKTQVQNLTLSHYTKIIVDCANGAISKIARSIFEELNFNAILINDYFESTGIINKDCGSEYVRDDPLRFINQVKMQEASYGLAFDGDGDRIVIVDNEGNFYNGDDLLYILAKIHFLIKSPILGNHVIATNGSNGALREALRLLNLETVLVKNGDRNLEEALKSYNCLLGGEQVGNIMINDGHHTAADPLYAIAFLLSYCEQNKTSLAEIVSKFQKRPQLLASVKLNGLLKDDKILSDSIPQQLSLIKGELISNNRIQIWHSSTERGILNVMVESDCDIKKIKNIALNICNNFINITNSSVSKISIFDLSKRNFILDQ